MSKDVIQTYVDAWNRRDLDRMLDCVADDIEHRINEGGTRRGKDTFAAFVRHAAEHYDEDLEDVVLLTGPKGRCGAEFMVRGVYRKTDDGNPTARGQRYQFPAAILCDVSDDRITRLTAFYNMADWLRQVS